MNWENYKKRFISAATSEGHDNLYINKWLSYAKNLHNNRLPIIYDSYHFSNLIGLDYTYLMAASNSPKHFYRRFKIPKRSGGERVIHEPLPDLKKIQKWIANEILSNIKVSEYSKAYRSNRSIKDNARFHIGQKTLLNIDIENYFHSIPFYKVNNFFNNLGYSKAISAVLANLCCLNNGLPQGSPTSPILSNLITKNLDIEIAQYCLDKRLRYTRYADDISISGDFNPKEVISFIKKTLYKHGFKTNAKKTNVKYSHERQIVTGITVNEKMQVHKNARRELRQIMYYIQKFSLESHMKREGIVLSRDSYLKHLLGKANHIHYINPSDNDVKQYIEQLHILLQTSHG